MTRPELSAGLEGASAIDDVGLDPGVSRLPKRDVDLEFPSRLSVVRCRRDVDLQLMGPRLLCNAVGPPQVFLQATQGGMVADKDVQGRSALASCRKRDASSKCHDRRRGVKASSELSSGASVG